MSTYKKEIFQAVDNTVSLGVADPIYGIIDHTEKFINQDFKDQTNELFQKHIVDKFKGTSYLPPNVIRYGAMIEPMWWVSRG